MPFSLVHERIANASKISIYGVTPLKMKKKNREETATITPWKQLIVTKLKTIGVLDEGNSIGILKN